MVRCGKCNKTFDEKRITGICPYCGNEKYFISITDSIDSKEEPPDSRPKVEPADSEPEEELVYYKPKAKPADSKPEVEPADSSKAILSLIIIVVFVVLAVFSTSNCGKEEERSPIENLQFIMDVERKMRE